MKLVSGEAYIPVPLKTTTQLHLIGQVLKNFYVKKKRDWRSTLVKSLVTFPVQLTHIKYYTDQDNLIL